MIIAKRWIHSPCSVAESEAIQTVFESSSKQQRGIGRHVTGGMTDRSRNPERPYHNPFPAVRGTNRCPWLMRSFANFYALFEMWRAFLTERTARAIAAHLEEFERLRYDNQIRIIAQGGAPACRRRGVLLPGTRTFRWLVGSIGR